MALTFLRGHINRNQPVGTRAWQTAVAPFMGMKDGTDWPASEKNPGS